MNHVSDALARLLSQYVDAENIRAMISALAQQTQDEEDALQDILSLCPLSVAENAQLDDWGAIENVPRGAMDDDDYRAAIYLRIFMNYSEGTIEDLIHVFAAFMGTDHVELAEYFPACVTLQARYSVDPDVVNARIAVQICKAGGVGIGMLSYTIDPPLVFLEDDDPDGLGLDDGSGTVGGYLAASF